MRTKISALIAVLLLASLALTACSTPAALAQTTSAAPETPRTLSVTGTGKSYLTPDIAYISIGVHTEDKDAGKAVSNNNALAKKVVDALKKFNIVDKDVQTTNFSIWPQQQYDQEGKVTGILYVVDNTVYVTLRDLAKIGELLDAVVTAGANTINGITFDVEDKTEALSEARAAAVEDAASQAAELAKAAGLTLGQVLNLSTYNSIPVPYFEGKGGGGAGVSMSAVAPISPGQTVVQVDVNILYEIK